MVEKFNCRTIVQDLEQQILTKKLASGVRLGTSRELWQRYNVSPRTIERALAHLARRGLIYRKPGQGTFVQSSLPLSEKAHVCLVSSEHGKPLDMPKLNQLAFGNMEKQLVEFLSSNGYFLEHLIAPCKIDNDHNMLLNRSLDKYDIYISPAWDFYFTKDFLRNSSITKILIGGDQATPGPWHQVVYDYRPGFAQAIRLFQKIGQHKIIVVGIEGNSTSQVRMKIFREEALRLGYQADDLILHYEKENKLSTLLDGQNFVDYYLQNNLQKFAIFSTSDYLSIGMMTEFQKRGMKPGKAFQLISYDNFEGQLPDPDFQFGITGITHPQGQLPSVVKTMLDDLTRQVMPGDFYRTYYVPAHELVIRQTTATPY